MIIKSSNLNRRTFFKGSLIAFASVATFGLSAKAETFPIQKSNKWIDQRTMALSLMAGIASGRILLKNDTWQQQGGPSVDALCNALDPVLVYISFRWLRSLVRTQEQMAYINNIIDSSQTINSKITSTITLKGTTSKHPVIETFDKDDSLIKQDPHQIIDWAIQQLQLVEA